MFCFVYHRQSHFFVPKRRVRYRYPRLFLTMYAMFGEFLGPRKGGLGTDTLHDSRKCALFLRFRCLRFTSDVASVESHRALGPFAIFTCFLFFATFLLRLSSTISILGVPLPSPRERCCEHQISPCFMSVRNFNGF